MAVKDFELYFLSVIKGKRKGYGASFMRVILWVLSYPFQVIVSLRNWMFDHGWYRSYIPPVPLVISIGNITTGGTGKTPVTLMLAKQFEEATTLAILSRGYRAQAEKFSSPVLLHKNGGVTHPASLCGDEAFLLSENLPEAFVIVGKDRYQSSKLAARMGAHVLLLDDAMQHRGIARDLEVVVMDLQDPFGQGYFLPRGLLREGKSALARADLIILNHAYEEEKLELLKKQISHVTSAPIVATQVKVVGVFDLEDKLLGPIDNTLVGIFCGIAHPEYFRNTVIQMGSGIVAELFVPDHDTFDPDHLIAFTKECAALRATWILCTEKDKVKLASHKGLHLPIAWVKTELNIIEGKESFDEFVAHAKMALKT